jgi:hypothetical protein
MRGTPTWAKFFIYSSVIATFIGYAFIGIFVVTIIKSGREDMLTINSAVHDIKLPNRYKLVTATYDDHRCLDVCAHTVLVYKSTDGKPLHVDDVYIVLRQHGYKTTELGYFYKMSNNHRVTVDASQDTPTDLTVDVSL